MENLINGTIVNEFDEQVGTYRHIMWNRYWVDLIYHGGKREMTRKELVDIVRKLDLYTIPDWN